MEPPVVFVTDGRMDELKVFWAFYSGVFAIFGFRRFGVDSASIWRRFGADFDVDFDVDFRFAIIP